MNRIPGTPSSRPLYTAAQNGAANYGPPNATGGGHVLEVSANNSGGAAVVVTVADTTGTFKKFTVPANASGSWEPRDGCAYAGQLTVTTSAALDVTVRLA